MSKTISRETPNTGVIRTEAGSWLAQLETGNLDYADVEILCEWMRRSPKHTSELRRLARLSGELNVLTEMSGALNEAAEFHHPVVRKHRNHPLQWVAFAGCIALVVLSLPLTLRSIRPWRRMWASMRSTICRMGR